MLKSTAVLSANMGLPALATCEIPEAPAHAQMRVVVFYSTGCTQCERAKSAVREVERKHADRIEIEMTDIDRPEDYAKLIPYEQHYGADENATLKVFVGDSYLAGANDVIEGLDAVVREQLEKGAMTFRPAQDSPDHATDEDDHPLPPSILQRFASFSVLAVAAAGLIDGVNPCAFTTIVFLLSMLAYLGKDRRQIAAAGAGFVAATFATYLVLGLGLLVLTTA